MKKILLSLTATTLLFTGLSFGTAKANDISFKDVSSDFWGFSNIQWAIENKIIDGYPDGTFKPNQDVYQNEFYAMLIRAYQPSDFSLASYKDESDWSLPYKQYAYKKRWEVIDWNPLMTRGEVAQVIANANGKNYNVDDSIQYLLDTGLSDGKTSKTIEGFKKDAKLTRTEALAFIQRLKESLNVLQDNAFDLQKYVPHITETPTITDDKIDESINLIANTDVYQLPSKNSTVIATVGPQSVQAFEKYGNWYQIHSTWLGDSWIYVDNTTKTNGYHAPTFAPLNEVSGKWQFGHQYDSLNGTGWYTVGSPFSPNIGAPFIDGVKSGNPVNLSLSIGNTAENTVSTITYDDFEVDIIRNYDGDKIVNGAPVTYKEVIWRDKLPAIPSIPLKYAGTIDFNFVWDQKDSEGNQVPPGRYTVQLKTSPIIEYTIEGKEGIFTEQISPNASTDRSISKFFEIK